MEDETIIKTIGNIPLRNGELSVLLGRYKSPSMKIASMEKEGQIRRLKRGVYVADGDEKIPVSKELCSNHIYGPSYLSLQWALSYYGLIPEHVFSLTAVTTKRSRDFQNDLGFFTYRQVPDDYFPIGIRPVQADGVTFLMASPEKALCDMILADLYIPSRSVTGLYRYLEEDLRFDMDELSHFDKSVLEQCAQRGHKKSILQNLIKIYEHYDNI